MHTSGETVSEALDNAKNAIVAYLMSIIKNGDPILILERGSFNCCLILMTDVFGFIQTNI